MDLNNKAISIRPFLGSRDFDLSSSFYKDIGFIENKISKGFSYFDFQGFGFYLQDAYVKDWINNTMVFMEVEDADSFYSVLLSKNLKDKYKTSKLSKVLIQDWGKECFLHDPAGNLWHFGTIN